MHKFIISGFADEIDKYIKVQFEALNDMGITYFEVRGVNGRNIAKLTDEQLEELKADMKQYGIKVSSIGSPIGKVFMNEDFEHHFDKSKRIVEIAKILEAKYIRMFSFHLPEGESWDAYHDEVIARLSRMVAYAEENDVILLHENEKDIYGESADRCVELFESIPSKNFRAVFDPANFVQCEEDVKEAFLKLRPYIEYMHIKDAIADGTVVPSGYGIGELPFILKSLKDSEYQGFLSLEPHLGSFEGLQDLELNGNMLQLEQSSKSTFELAYNALKEVLGGI